MCASIQPTAGPGPFRYAATVQQETAASQSLWSLAPPLAQPWLSCAPQAESSVSVFRIDTSVAFSADLTDSPRVCFFFFFLHLGREGEGGRGLCTHFLSFLPGRQPSSRVPTPLYPTTQFPAAGSIGRITGWRTTGGGIGLFDTTNGAFDGNAGVFTVSSRRGKGGCGLIRGKYPCRLRRNVLTMLASHGTASGPRVWNLLCSVQRARGPAFGRVRSRHDSNQQRPGLARRQWPRRHPLADGHVLFAQPLGCVAVVSGSALLVCA